MDKIKAKEWEKRLTGKPVKGWCIESLIDHGKSAAVFRARKGQRKAALKLFDDELIERYGDTVQLARINRELTLADKEHPNMVRILDGGFDEQSANHFIVMECLEGPNLRSALQDVSDKDVPELVEQLASVCEFLESHKLVHRDIKPENIILLNDLSKLVLLDFGVLRPIGEVGVTDADGIQSFVGTLQYSSPEFLLRKEEDTVEGWRALTFYQIGGVIHDLIMRKPLFEEFANPYARLVNAVQHDTPLIESSTAPAYLVEAAKSALAKDPNTRDELLDWNSFKRPKHESLATTAKNRVTKRSLRLKAEQLPLSAPGTNSGELRETVIRLLKLELRKIRNSNTGGLPPLTSVALCSRGSDTLMVKFQASETLDLPDGLTIFVKTEVIDAAAHAVRISALSERGHSSGLSSKGFVDIFQGIFPAAALSDALEACVYVAVDQVQRGKSTIDLSKLAAE
jgi:eukaryotic-like serine/threonine-protein kinase